MVHIKRISMQGFKSFAKKTDIILDKGINVILGPNGSGKSNISDALCFVLGRLSIKSMRAAKAKNLLFMGSKFVKPSHEAIVELVFDNEDKSFSLNSSEIGIKRIVRRNGQSIYKINEETKTRSEVIELLAQAGIDPYGFNIILQGQIQSIVRMHPEERRKIIEEVAGIAIYESRKEKSLKELEKTEERLKEISAILRERTAYLRNLEKERAQALKFKELETTAKRCKASILSKKADGKGKEVNSVVKSIEEKTKHKDKRKESADKLQKEMDELRMKIEDINKHIQLATGVEQETLHSEVADVKGQVEGLRVRKESYENRRAEIERRIEEMNKNIPEIENEINELKTKSPMMAKKAQEIKKKKEELASLEEERRRLLTAKNELNSLKERTRDKERQLAKVIAESESVLKQIEANSEKLSYKDEKECSKALESLREDIESERNKLALLGENELKNEKMISVSEAEISNSEKIKGDIQKIDVCPLCQSKMTPEHVGHVLTSSDTKINNAQEVLNNAKSAINLLKKEKEGLMILIKSLSDRISSGDVESLRHRAIKEKQMLLKNLVEEEKTIKDEINALDERRKSLEAKLPELGKIEEKYDSKILEIQEISSRTEEDVDTTLLYKERELENIRNVIKRSSKDFEDINLDIGEISQNLENKLGLLETKEEQERELNDKFKKMFAERDTLQKDMQDKSLNINETQTDIRQIEDQINYLKIGKAKLDAEKEAIEMELSEYTGLELLQGSIENLQERLAKSQETLMQIGSINLRALEVYDEIKKEYDAVQEKVNTLDKEKQDIMSIIEEIDKKKKREFMKTFNAISTLFTENFSRLYTKGIAYLDMENKEDIFAGGVDIVVKLAKGKYFDVTSLSGGEQTMVALALLFAIQEHKPYHFYIFDEIDAALDKRNSERLANLLKSYMNAGQYVVVTHNDAIITESDVLYGVSMHDGISKILSLKITEDAPAENKENNAPIGAS